MKRFEVKGYTNTGIYAQWVEALSAGIAVRMGATLLKELFPDRVFLKFVANLDA